MPLNAKFSLDDLKSEIKIYQTQYVKVDAEFDEWSNRIIVTVKPSNDFLSLVIKPVHIHQPVTKIDNEFSIDVDRLHFLLRETEKAKREISEKASTLIENLTKLLQKPEQ